MGKFDLNKIQNLIKKSGLDAWLLFDFRGSNTLSHDVLDIPKNAHLTRRFYYFIPAEGQPVKIVNAIERHTLKHLPGIEKPYSSRQILDGYLRETLAGVKKVAMEYSPMNAIPYLSRVDAGTIEYLKSFGLEIVPSGDLITMFNAVWTNEQYTQNVPVAAALVEIVKSAFAFIKENLSSGKKITEYDAQQFIMGEFAKRGYFTDSPPIVGVNGNAANPHYSPDSETHAEIKMGDFILIDLWAKPDDDAAVWSDITWTGYAGKEAPRKMTEVFNIVRDARDAALSLVKERFEKGLPVKGFEVDDASRNVIVKAGYGDYFIHRTGHSITTDLHGSGPHMDNFETHDERTILPSTSFSIEPGIYLPGEFGVRNEIDVYVHPDGRVEQTGGEKQNELILLFA
ncbi:MAG: aminopeptidase P family protein [Ignavibacteriaceae bacterium]|nr:Xaa-Pro peptidase family protein [Ignavibacteriaceae bacterium]NUM71050.1 aminopeptidase P family protein [Ignavibacteriaceae bacterium]